MKPITRLIISALIASLPVGALLICGCGGSEVIGYRGGSEVVGRLVTEDSLPVAGAVVAALTADSLDERGKPARFDTAAVTSSDETGMFKFEKLNPGDYYLSASREADSLILQFIAFRPDSTRRIDLGTLVMKRPGAIGGTVVPPNRVSFAPLPALRIWQQSTVKPASLF